MTRTLGRRALRRQIDYLLFRIWLAHLDADDFRGHAAVREARGDDAAWNRAEVARQLALARRFAGQLLELAEERVTC